MPLTGRAWDESIGGEVHVEGLVRPVGVVLGAEGVDRSLRRVEVGEDFNVVEQFALQALVEPFDLARGGGRAGFGVADDDAVLSADPLEHDLGRAGLGKPAGELLAVVRYRR